jgi:hypothetical protein
VALKKVAKEIGAVNTRTRARTNQGRKIDGSTRDSMILVYALETWLWA